MRHEARILGFSWLAGGTGLWSWAANECEASFGLKSASLFGCFDCLLLDQEAEMDGWMDGSARLNLGTKPNKTAVGGYKEEIVNVDMI